MHVQLSCCRRVSYALQQSMYCCTSEDMWSSGRCTSAPVQICGHLVDVLLHHCKICGHLLYVLLHQCKICGHLLYVLLHQCKIDMWSSALCTAAPVQDMWSSALCAAAPVQDMWSSGRFSEEPKHFFISWLLLKEIRYYEINNFHDLAFRQFTINLSTKSSTNRTVVWFSRGYRNFVVQ